MLLINSCTALHSIRAWRSKCRIIWWFCMVVLRNRCRHSQSLSCLSIIQKSLTVSRCWHPCLMLRNNRLRRSWWGDRWCYCSLIVWFETLEILDGYKMAIEFNLVAFRRQTGFGELSIKRLYSQYRVSICKRFARTRTYQYYSPFHQWEQALCSSVTESLIAVVWINSPFC